MPPESQRETNSDQPRLIQVGGMDFVLQRDEDGELRMQHARRIGEHTILAGDRCYHSDRDGNLQPEQLQAREVDQASRYAEVEHQRSIEARAEQHSLLQNIDIRAPLTVGLAAAWLTSKAAARYWDTPEKEGVQAGERDTPERGPAPPERMERPQERVVDQVRLQEQEKDERDR